MVTGFVALMMVLVEYFNVLNRGTWQRALAGSRWRQYVVATVPDHFLEQHLWRHVVLQHVPRIFLWIFGVLAAISVLRRFLDVGSFVQENSWLVLALAGIVGIVPESGPHLFFVTLFDDGSLPLSVLAASSIVQDGHGTLPILAHSWRSFLKIKAINLVIGLLIGALMLSLGI